MINLVTIVTEDSTLLFKKEIQKDVLISFEINNVSFFEKLSRQEIYKVQSLDTTRFFSFYLNVAQKEKASIFFETAIEKKELFLRYFFHPAYKVINEKPVVAFNANYKDDADLIRFVQELEQTTISQGYDGIQWVIFSNNSDQVNDYNVLFDNRQPVESAAVYSEILKKYNYTNKYIGIKTTDVNDWYSTLQSAEEKIMQEYPEKFDYLKKYGDLERSFVQTTDQLKRTNLDLENHKKYLEIFKSKDEALKIYEFYKYEYEILPLWYKRFGHIIKVIMGKRSFRSLFDNNIKKYND